MKKEHKNKPLRAEWPLELDNDDKRLQFGAIALAASLTLLFGFFYYLSRTNTTSKSSEESIVLEDVSQSDTRSSAPTNSFPGAEGEDSSEGSENEKRGNGIISSLHRESLKSVKDDTPLRRQEEIRPWFHIFALLNVTPLAILQKASVGPVLPEMLNDNPEEYRGKVVTVRGRLVRCRKVPCGPNEIGMRAYYEVWMVPKKNAKQPINICAIEVCRPLRDEAAKGKPVEATGIFFKRRAFAKESKVVQTPVVLAKQLRQIKGIHSEKERRFSAGQAFMIFLLAAILGVGGVLMVRILLRVLGEKLNEPASSENKASDKPPGETELPKEAKPPEQGASDPDLVESR